MPSTAPGHYMTDDYDHNALQYSQVDTSSSETEDMDDIERDADGLFKDTNKNNKTKKMSVRSPPSSSRRNRFVAISVISVVVLGLILVAAIVLIGNSRSKNDEASTSVEETQRPGDADIPFPPKYLHDLCSPIVMQHQGKTGCANACAPSKCCWIPLNETGSCYYKEVECRLYRENCDTLERPGEFHEGGGGAAAYTGEIPTDDGDVDDNSPSLIEDADPNIEQVCSQSNMDASLEGIRQCASLCIHASCCYDDNSNNCEQEQPKCAGYKPCYLLAAKLQSDDLDNEPNYPPDYTPPP